MNVRLYETRRAWIDCMHNDNDSVRSIDIRQAGGSESELDGEWEMLITKQLHSRHILYSICLVMLLIAGFGIASAVDIPRPDKPAFKFIYEDMNPTLDVPLAKVQEDDAPTVVLLSIQETVPQVSQVQEDKGCSTCGSRPAFIGAQEFDALAVAPFTIQEVAPQVSELCGHQEDADINAIPFIKPQASPAQVPALEAYFYWYMAPIDYCYDQATSGRGYCVQFIDASRFLVDPITSWKWDFSTGKTRRGQCPAHWFEDPGDYVVILRVSNGFNTSAAYQIVTVK